MCDKCKNPRAKHLKNLQEVAGNPRFDPATDTMPDGIHAKLYKFWEFNKNANHDGMGGTVKQVSLSPGEMEFRHRVLQKEYAELPEPRPNYMEWASFKTESDRFRLLDEMSLNARLIVHRIKATSLLLQYGKSLPKQKIELTGDEKVDLNELLRRICQLKNIPTEEVERLIGNAQIN